MNTPWENLNTPLLLVNDLEVKMNTPVWRGLAQTGVLISIKICVISHQCTVILIELPCIFFLPEILDIQGFSASAGITEPVLESFPGRAFSVYSVFYRGSRCNFEYGATGNNAPVVTLTESPGNNYFRCNFVFSRWYFVDFHYCYDFVLFISFFHYWY